MQTSNLCPEKVVFLFLMKSTQIPLNLLLLFTHTHMLKHQRPPGTPFCHPISPKQHTSLLRPAPTKAAIIWMLPKMPRALTPVFNSLLSNYHRLGTGEESGTIRSFLFTCSQNTHAHTLTQTPRVGGQDTHLKAPEVIFLSNYNLWKNVENLLLVLSCV